MSSPVSPHPVTGTIVVVDDLPANLQLLNDILSGEGHRVLQASDGDEALSMIWKEEPDLVLSDVRMPGSDGFSLCRALRDRAATRLLPIVLMTGAAESHDRISAIEAGANDFLTKPIDQAELKARVRSLLRLKRYTDDLDSAEAVLRSLALMIEARDAYTDGHCQRLAAYATQLGRRLSLPDDDLQVLARGGYFHDIGKMALPDSILLKPGSLTAEEFTRVKAHTVIGDRLCGDVRALHQVRAIVRHHHERLDGSGYPDGLSGDGVPLLAQIIGIVDVYDAITTDRPYRSALPRAAALDQLRQDVHRGWRRADLVDAFVASSQPTGGEPADGLFNWMS
ncbi:MAG: HD domain-containing phosphohydrolase [Vicinamibacterales bacterium]